MIFSFETDIPQYEVIHIEQKFFRGYGHCAYRRNNDSHSFKSSDNMLGIDSIIHPYCSKMDESCKKAYPSDHIIQNMVCCECGRNAVETLQVCVICQYIGGIDVSVFQRHKVSMHLSGSTTAICPKFSTHSDKRIIRFLNKLTLSGSTRIHVIVMPVYRNFSMAFQVIDGKYNDDVHYELYKQWEASK